MRFLALRSTERGAIKPRNAGDLHVERFANIDALEVTHVREQENH
jgi:hypothetical protein